MAQCSCEGQRLYLSSQCTFRPQSPFLLASLEFGGTKNKSPKTKALVECVPLITFIQNVGSDLCCFVPVHTPKLMLALCKQESFYIPVLLGEIAPVALSIWKSISSYGLGKWWRMLYDSCAWGVVGSSRSVAWTYMKGLPVWIGEETVVREEAEPQHITHLTRALKPGKQLMRSYHFSIVHLPWEATCRGYTAVCHPTGQPSTSSA